MLCQVFLAVDLVSDSLDGRTPLNHVHTSGSHSGTALLNWVALRLVQLHFRPICALTVASPSFLRINCYLSVCFTVCLEIMC